MTYTDWLEKEINIYKRENKLLKDKHENLTTMFNEVHDNELETRDKKNEILKWVYSLEKENAQLKKELRYWLNENDCMSYDKIVKMSTELLFMYVKEMHEVEIRMLEVK